MLQLTSEELLQLREKSKGAGSWIYPLLESTVAPIREHYRIQKTGLGTWRNFFACPDDSAPLTFDIESPESHACPVCGKRFSGEPYDGAWWMILNAKNSDACRAAALLWLLGGDAAHLDFAKRILTDYATYYPDYEVHGNIPYNNPGRANAQTLTDAQWIKPLLAAYDFIRGELTKQERDYIESRFLSPAADFFVRYREPQLHNHELMVGSAIGILGLLLERDDLVDFAVHSKYGFLYQLEHGLLADGMWFEGTTSYHFEALMQIVQFNCFAKTTGHSIHNNELLLRALKFPVNLIMPDGAVPRLNDIGATYQGFTGLEGLFEPIYAEHPCREFAYYLTRCYDGRERKNYFAFVYGADFEPTSLAFGDYHNADGSGLSILRGPEDRYLLFKHTPYGGEHDHYDRLGIHFMGFGKMIAPDIGTCYYGAPMHYLYYKNTAAHNTVCLDGHNQPPTNCRVLRYEKTDAYTLIDAEAAWDGSYRPLDSFVIPQWDEHAYRDARFRRVIAWYGDFFIDVFDVDAPNATTIDWILHLRATPEQENLPKTGAPLAEEGPYSYLTRLLESPESGKTERRRWSAGDGVVFTLHTAGDARFLLCDGPDNPSTARLSYAIRRVEGTKARYIGVFECAREGAPVLSEADIRLEDENIFVRFWRTDGAPEEFRYQL